MKVMRAIGDTIRRQKGYLLPATILLGLGTAIMAGAFLQFTAISSQTLTGESYNNIAQEAARSGIEYADSCLSINGTSSSWSSLTPGTDCSGNSSGGSVYLHVQGSGAAQEWRSTFSVSNMDALSQITSTGTVQLMKNGNPVQTYTSISKMSLGNLIQTYPISTGESITDIKNDTTDCAIANGKLYCWGDNSSGQLGDGTTNNSAVPKLVGGALAGKTVTRVSVASTTVCAIADGSPYCWGSDSANQLGNGGGGDVHVPTANVPTTSSGPLSGKIVTDIGTSSWNNPASVIWPFASAFPHSDALTADGSVSSWGDGGFRQNTGGGCVVVLFICTGFYSYPSYASPTLTAGYAGGGEVLSGVKSERVGASSHDGCSLAQGKLICWGVQAPIAIWCNSVLFSAAWETVVPFNACVAAYSNGYDASNISGSSMAGQFMDPNLFDVSSNEGCFMSGYNYSCFGVTPAFGLFWVPGAWGAPWLMESNADVTDADNGDDVSSMGISGLFCDIDKGVAKCAGQPGNPYTGTGTSGYAYRAPLITSSGLNGKVPFKIAAGQQHGCVVANGQLLCWGSEANGALADGSNNIFGYVPNATLTGTGGANPIGSTNGTYAATGQISVGGDHTCGIANGKLFCWGKNQYGQLGQGNTTDLSQPTNVPTLSSFTSVTKVSAGEDHTCAIIYGQLYCWGHNANGQLGIGNTTDQTTPQLVNGHGVLTAGMRVTDVSAGNGSTCAIANGQALCWGNNSNQQIGDGTTTQRTSPVFVNGGANPLNGKAVTQITMGTSHACAIANADLYCWGSNANGRTGLNTTLGNANPTKVNGGTAGAPGGPNGVTPMATSVSAGTDFTCAVFNGTASCWGDNANGRTGLTLTVGNQLIPAAVRNLGGTINSYYATTISAGDAHACAVLNGNNSATNGNLYCWGTGANGRLGNGAVSDKSTVTLINGGATVDGSGARRVAINVDAGGSSTCAVANGDILCWGEGTNGRLGNGGVADSSLPVTTLGYRYYAPYAKGPVY